MSFKKVALILSVVFALLAVAGSLLGIHFIKSKNENIKNITLSGDGISTETLAVSLENFYPTLTENYNINLRCTVSGTYKVKLQLEKTGDGTLDKYLNLQVVCDNKEIASGKLSEFLQGKLIEFECAISDTAVKIEIRFTMPQEVGNEGQNTAVDFNIILSAESK